MHGLSIQARTPKQKPQRDVNTMSRSTEVVQVEKVVTHHEPIMRKVVVQVPKVRVEKLVEIPEIQIDEWEGNQSLGQEKIVTVSEPVMTEHLIEIPLSEKQELLEQLWVQKCQNQKFTSSQNNSDNVLL